jgi:uncharacterized protein DUF6924
MNEKFHEANNQSENALVHCPDFLNGVTLQEICAEILKPVYKGSRNEFRAIPSQIQGIENNLSIANMDFEGFAEAVNEDGVFRGFPMIMKPGAGTL